MADKPVKNKATVKSLERDIKDLMEWADSMESRFTNMVPAIDAAALIALLTLKSNDTKLVVPKEITQELLEEPLQAIVEMRGKIESYVKSVREITEKEGNKEEKKADGKK